MTGPFDDTSLTVPCSPPAEKATLGCVLLDNAWFQPARQQILNAEYFYDQRNRVIWRVIVEMRDAGKGVDLLTLKEELERQGKSDAAGGAPYVCGLVDGVAASRNVVHYASIVAEKARLRKIARDGMHLLQVACHRNGGGPGEDVEEVCAAIQALNVTAAELTPEGAELEVLDLAAEAPPMPEALVGDVRQQLLIPGEVLMIASDPGRGKTLMSLDIALGVAAGTAALGFPCQQRGVVYCSSDGDPHVLRKLHRLWEGRGRKHEDLKALPLAVIADDGFNLDLETCYASLVSTLKRQGFEKHPGLLILESLATNVDAAKVSLDKQLHVRGWATRRLRSLQGKFPGLTITLSAHLKKPQFQAPHDLASRVAGSIQILAVVDSAVGLVARGRERFAVREVKRSRSGATFEPFEVRIEGAPHEPLALRNTGSLEPSLEELRGTASDILAHLREHGPKGYLKDIERALKGKHHADTVRKAAKRLAEAEPPRLLRFSKKPAGYELPSPQRELGLEGME